MKTYNRRDDERKKAKQRYKNYKRKNNKGIWKIIVAISILLIGIVIGVFFMLKPSSEEETEQFSDGDLVIEKVIDNQNSTEVNTEGEIEETENIEDDLLTNEEIEEQVEQYLSSMNTEARVGQLFFITPEELTGIGTAVQAGETTKTMLKTYKVGGIILSEQNFEVLDQMKLMVSNLKVYSSYPLFVAVDESGAVRITNTKNTLEETGFNMESIESELYLLNETESVNVSDELNVVNLEDGDVVSLVKEGAHIILVDDGFEKAYETLLDAVRSGEIDSVVLEERVREIMTYKVENDI